MLGALFFRRAHRQKPDAREFDAALSPSTGLAEVFMRRYVLFSLPVLLLALLAAALAGDDEPQQSSFQSNARYPTEEQALARADELGVGEASLVGPSEVIVDSLAEITIRFTVGPSGMKTGGGLRVATAHGFGWDMWGGTFAQATNPLAENYLTYRTSSGTALRWTPYGQVQNNELFTQYHPWQNINEFVLAGPDLAPGDSIEITYGDRRGGSPGVRIQPMDETAFLFKIYVDPLGDGDYLPIRNNPALRIRAAAPRELKVIAQTDWQVDQPGWVNVWADDGYGNPADRYRGTVSMALAEARREAAELPPDYAFQESDQGAHRFEAVTFRRPGTYRIRVTDGSANLLAESNPVVVHPAEPNERIYWGDIHTHTMYSDGRGRPAEMYDFGKRIASLDFCSVSDHAFTTTDAMWREIQDVTNRYYEPGRYVTFLAYEWSGMTDVGGDHNVYTTDSQMPLIRSYSYYNYKNLRMYHGPDKGANHVEELFRMIAGRFRDENLLVIPHFGGRQGNPAWHNPALQRQIEIFSDHRRSEDWVTSFLEKGYRVGVMASTDNHSGNAGYGVRRIEVRRGEEGEVFSRFSPIERGTALVAVYAKDLTREGIFQGLYHRRTYATTGSRIILRFEVEGIPMGSEGQVTRAPNIRATATGTAPIETMRIVKNGRVIYAVSPAGRSASLNFVDSSGEYEGAFYYLDLVQTDGEKAVSSPVWVN